MKVCCSLFLTKVINLLFQSVSLLFILQPTEQIKAVVVAKCAVLVHNYQMHFSFSEVLSGFKKKKKETFYVNSALFLSVGSVSTHTKSQISVSEGRKMDRG